VWDFAAEGLPLVINLGWPEQWLDSSRPSLYPDGYAIETK
jgi:hypothetical protein